MISTATTSTQVPANDAATGPRTLDDLAALDVAALRALYEAGRVPALTTLTGTPRCRMLAVRGLDGGPVATGLRRLAAASFFPWAGKAFSADSADAGSGINRVRLAGERRWFPFATRIEASAIDARPCILLDYDQPENPAFIRAIRDELREVAPGLFLGPAMLKTGRKPALLLFFACHFAPVN